jgi:hypothetical protein
MNTTFSNDLRARAGGRPAPRRAGERGSAFTVALLVLLVLTISGLAVTLMTQTEVRIGSNERTANRSLYAADSGVEVATARENSLGPDTQSRMFMLNTTAQDTGIAFSSNGTTYSDQVTITPLIPLSTEYCNLCMINPSTGSTYVYINYVVNATAARIGQDGSGTSETTQTVASKVVGVTMGMQPQPSTNVTNPQAALISVQY